MWLIPLTPRVASYDVLANTDINEEKARALSVAADKCWDALLERNAVEVGKTIAQSFEAQIAMFPNMVIPEILEQLELYKNHTLGWKLSGAGGGGYLILFSEKPVENAIQIRIRRG